MAPAKRARTSGPTTAQSTLSFNRSKPTANPPASKAAKPSTPAKQADTPPPAPAVADVTVPARAATPEPEPEDADVLAARKISQAAVNKYWAAKERERKAGRVHQETLGVREKVLREFDMTSRYGPSIGITRMARWMRARDLGMKPPMEVLAVLVKESDEASGASKSEKSIMDELIMSSKLGRDVVAEA